MNVLQWRDHAFFIKSQLIHCYNNGSLVDFTLSVEDKLIKVHKNVLAAGSPFFERVFMSSPDKDLLIIEGFMYDDVKLIIDYMYYGSVEVTCDQLKLLQEFASLLEIDIPGDVSAPTEDIYTSQVFVSTNAAKNASSKDKSIDDCVPDKEIIDNCSSRSEAIDCRQFETSDSPVFVVKVTNLDENAENDNLRENLRERDKDVLQETYLPPIICVTSEDACTENSDSVKALELKDEHLMSEIVEIREIDAPKSPVVVIKISSPNEKNNNCRREWNKMDKNNDNLRENSTENDSVSCITSSNPNIQILSDKSKDTYEDNESDEVKTSFITNRCSGKENLATSHNNLQDVEEDEGSLVHDIDSLIKHLDANISNDDNDVLMRENLTEKVNDERSECYSERIVVKEKKSSEKDFVGGAVASKEHSEIDTHSIAEGISSLETVILNEQFACGYGKRSDTRESYAESDKNRNVCFDVRVVLEKIDLTSIKAIPKLEVLNEESGGAVGNVSPMKDTSPAVKSKKNKTRGVNTNYHLPTDHNGKRKSREILNYKGKNPWQCDYCDERFKYHYLLRNHERKHSQDQPFICNDCGRRFSNKAVLIAHSTIHTKDTPYNCELCGRKFALKHSLKDHIMFHMTVNPLKCEECGEVFRKKSRLKVHQSIHGGPAPFQCAECGKQFSRKANLTIHILSHSTLTPYSCDVCGKLFKFKIGLQSHLSIQPKPLVCERCGEMFKVRCKFQHHKRMHKVETPFECVCGKIYGRRTHIVRHHRKDCPLVHRSKLS